MRHSIQTGMLLGGMLLALVSSTAGCDFAWGCMATATCEPEGTGGGEGTEGAGGAGGHGGVGGEGGGPACPEDPAEGEAGEDCGIFVSASGGDDGNPGTRELPVKTLSHAIALAKKGEGRVYACAEVYTETITLGGVSLYGGFDCAHDWTYVVAEEQRAEILAPPALAAITLVESATRSLVFDVRVIASDAVEPGASSIVVFALPGSRASFRRAELIAGDGADGADGEDGSHNGQPAPKGLAGNDGSHACTMDVGLGGLAPITHCSDGTTSIGGQGGNANELAANDGLAGIPAPDPNVLNHGAGGKGENAARGLACSAGNGGTHGKDGADGANALGYGKLTIHGHVGVAGGDGQPGLPGQGGGGGGASLGHAFCGAAPHGGAGGGSGGSGGCGGRGGRGGQAGGASLVFALLSGGIHVDDVVLISGNGGRGGNGGALQPGGQGGLPGYGGTGFGGASGPQNGCAGGAGGAGGDGGNGGGGHGGHSAIVGSLLNYQLDDPTADRIVGQAGKGGYSGNPASGAAENGVAGAVVTFEP